MVGSLAITTPERRLSARVKVALIEAGLFLKVMLINAIALFIFIGTTLANPSLSPEERREKEVSAAGRAKRSTASALRGLVQERQLAGTRRSPQDW